MEYDILIVDTNKINSDTLNQIHTHSRTKIIGITNQLQNNDFFWKFDYIVNTPINLEYLILLCSKIYYDTQHLVTINPIVKYLINDTEMLKLLYSDEISIDSNIKKFDIWKQRDIALIFALLSKIQTNNVTIIEDKHIKFHINNKNIDTNNVYFKILEYLESQFIIKSYTSDAYDGISYTYLK